MYAFTQHRPTTVRQAASLLAKQEEAKLLAGGHTLIPTMKLRLAGPKNLVDLSKIEGFTGIEMSGRSLTIGAMTPHVEVATSAVVKENIPALADLAGLIGDPAVRHRGTIGGSIANNDPNADYPAAVPRARRHHHHQQAAHRGGRFLQGPVRDRARGRRDHHQGAVPQAQQGGLCEIPQPGLALRAGRRVRVEAQLRDPRGGDRRRLQRRVPRDFVRGGAEEALRREVARRA